MKSIKTIKDQIKKIVVKNISEIKGVISITFVGSFESSTDLRLISDIDIIVIVNKLTQTLFLEIEKKTSSIKSEDLFLKGYQIKLNLSFGPLKLNDKNNIVFHLMIYDVQGHKKHVTESPFTCLDWEYFPASFGENLKDIYSAKGLQLEDLIGTRRGIDSYLDDLKNQKISYKVYNFKKNVPSEKKLIYLMDERHRKEYSYHVIKFLMLNLIKIIRQTNKQFSVEELSHEFCKLSEKFKKHSAFFIDLHNWKYNQQEEPGMILERLEEFVQDLRSWYENIINSSPTISFIRHSKTSINDGTFLGIGRNPDILPVENIDIPSEEFDCIYTGTLQRTISTGDILKGAIKIQDSLLNEIDYGQVEGLCWTDLPKKYPDLVDAWKRKEDPKFPGGESQKDVSLRLEKFISKVKLEKKSAVVTHNVILRVLIGKALDLPINSWFKLNPGHLEIHNFIFIQNKLIPALTKDQRIRYKNLTKNEK